MAELFHLTAPPRTTNAGAAPCLVLLHGRGSNEEDLFGLVPALPDELFVVSPRGPMPMEWGGYCWYQIEAVGKPEPDGFLQSLSMLQEFISGLAARYPIDPAQVIVGGFSQGAMMTACLTLSFPRLVRAAIMMSGYLPPVPITEDLEGCRGKPLFQAHGTQDGVLPFAWGLEARKHLEQSGLDVEFHEYQMDHQVVPQEMADISTWLKLHIGG